MGEKSYGIDPKRIKDYAQEITITQKGVEIAIVIGGGNIFRGMAGSNEGSIGFKQIIWECLPLL